MWQDISTAPKDNTEIIGARNMTVEIIRWIDGIGWFCRDEQINLWKSFPPTHWMPLPAPPAASPVTDATAIISNALGNNPSIDIGYAVTAMKAGDIVTKTGQLIEPDGTLIANMYRVDESKND